MKRALALLVAASAIAGSAAASQAWELKQGLHVYPYPGAEPAKLTPHVMVFLPKGYEQRKAPLLISLHNTADAGNDLERIKARGLARQVAADPGFPFIAAWPQASASYMTFDAAGVSALIDELISRLPVDPARIYLTGISSSAAWTWRIAAETGRFSAIVLVSSAGLDPAQACALKGTAVWAFHNESDPIRPTPPVKAGIDAVTACQGAARLTVYPKSGHDAWTDAYADPSLYQWLGDQRR